MFENRATAIQAVHDLKLSKKMIGAAAGFPGQRVSDFCNSMPLPSPMEERITDTIEAIAFVWRVFAPFKVALDSPELLEAGVTNAINEQKRRNADAVQAELEKLGHDTAAGLEAIAS